MTPLDRPLRRLVRIDGTEYVVTISPDGLRIVRKGHRKGYEVAWPDILAGEPTLRAQLVRSLTTSATPSRPETTK